MKQIEIHLPYIPDKRFLSRRYFTTFWELQRQLKEELQLAMFQACSEAKQRYTDESQEDWTPIFECMMICRIINSKRLRLTDDDALECLNPAIQVLQDEPVYTRRLNELLGRIDPRAKIISNVRYIKGTKVEWIRSDVPKTVFIISAL